MWKWLGGVDYVHNHYIHLSNYLPLSVYGSSADLNVTVDDGEASCNGDENHKVWSGSQDQLNSTGRTENLRTEQRCKSFCFLLGYN